MSKIAMIISLSTIMLLGITCIVIIQYIANSKQNSCEKNKTVVIRLIDEVWSKGNLEVVDQLVAPQYTIRHDPGDAWDGKTLDIATYKKRVTLSRSIFPDQVFHIHDVICNKDKIAISWDFTGTHEGKIPGLPTTNKQVTVSGLTIYYFSNHKIVGHWQVVDRLGFFEQLNIKPENH